MNCRHPDVWLFLLELKRDAIARRPVGPGIVILVVPIRVVVVGTSTTASNPMNQTPPAAKAFSTNIGFSVRAGRFAITGDFRKGFVLQAVAKNGTRN